MQIYSYIRENVHNLDDWAVFSSAVVGMFFPYRHVGIIWSWRRHATVDIIWVSKSNETPKNWKNKSFSDYTRIHYKLTLIPIH